MRNIDKNTCFDLKQLSLFVKNELSEYDLNKISNHLKDCEECSETVENVRNFYFVDAEEMESDFSSSKKELNFISFKYIFKEKISFFKRQIGSVFGSGYGMSSGTTISSGSNPVLNLSASVILSIVSMFFCVGILFSPISQEFLLDTTEVVKEEDSSDQLAHNSIIYKHYKERKDRINELMRVYDGGLNIGLAVAPMDYMVNKRNGGVLAVLD